MTYAKYLFLYRRQLAAGQREDALRNLVEAILVCEDDMALPALTALRVQLEGELVSAKRFGWLRLK